MIMPMEKTSADKKDEKNDITLVETGIAGLDDILRGGLSPGGLYLIERTSGTGKTTLGLQFALAGAAHGESVVYVTLSETQKDLESVAHSHGWDLDNVHVMQALAPQAKAATMFYPSEVELEELMTRLKAEIQRIGPARIVIDSLSEIRLMAEGPLRYRREMMGLKQFLASGRSTVLLHSRKQPAYVCRWRDPAGAVGSGVRVGTAAFVDRQSPGQKVCRRVP
jgi:circadian clock protein KaiC